MLGKDQDTSIKQSQAALDQPMLLGKVLKDQDTLIELTPLFEML